MHYLDNSATTKPCQAAVNAAVAAMTEDFGNPSSLHRLGLNAENIMTGARRTLSAQLTGSVADADSILFTSGATESNNLAILGSAEANRRAGHTILTTTIEHPSVLEPLAHLESEGWRVVKISPRADGSFSPDDFAAAADEDTVLVSVMLVNNEVGTILPVGEIARAVRRKNPKILVHCDAVQAFGKIPFKAASLGADLISVSGHKLYAPKGIGALYVRKGVRCRPRLYGGGQQRGFRPGTEPIPQIAAFAAAVADVRPRMEETLSRYLSLKDHLLRRLSACEEVLINSPAEAAPYIVNLSAGRVRSEVMLHFLEQEGIYVSSGSACSKGAKSHVLEAMKLPPARIDSALRVSFSRETTEADIDAFADRLLLGLKTLATAR